MLNSELVQIPEDYLCPITQELMENPVIAADGHTYERDAIVRWLQTGHKTGPMTGERLNHDVLTENHRLKAIIQSFKQNIPAIQRERQIKIDLDEAIKLREELIAHYLEKNEKEKVDYAEALAEKTQENEILKQKVSQMEKQIKELSLLSGNNQQQLQHLAPLKIEMKIKEDLNRLAELPQKEKYTQLKLGFSTSFKNMKKLCSNLNKFVAVSSLRLNFSGSYLFVNKTISDEDLRELCLYLKDLKLLTNLELYFAYGDIITDVGVREVSASIKNITSLRHLKLDFGGCDLITDGATREVGACVKDLTLLTHLLLDFSGCTRISNIGLENLSTGIKSLTSLTDLQLSFGGFLYWNNHSLSDLGIKEVSRCVKSLRSLENLSISFEYCKLITSAGNTELKELLNKYK